MAKQKILRTVSELNARYARFCKNHDLEASIPAHEQIAETEKQQLWLDSHVEALELAIAAEKGAAQLKSNVTLEDSKTGAKKAAAILSAIGNKDAAISAMMRKGEKLIASLNIIETSRNVTMKICTAAGYKAMETKTNKLGQVQMGWDL
tara:strand:+ start:1817 stop:2263 length:447 start_codon:yes stop_codon:yes gene_type:complete